MQGKAQKLQGNLFDEKVMAFAYIQTSDYHVKIGFAFHRYANYVFSDNF